MLVVLSAGCSTIPAIEQAEAWRSFSVPGRVSGRYFADGRGLILDVRFPPEVKSVGAQVGMDIPGNGLDIYTTKGNKVKKLEEGNWRIEVTGDYRYQGRMHFILTWKTESFAWPKQQFFQFRFSSNQLYYSAED